MNGYSPDQQRLFFNGLLNCRELGGMPLAGGKLFKNKVFVRSDINTQLSDETIKAMVKYGITADVDLRATVEAKREIDPLSKSSSINYYNVPLFDGDPNVDDDPTMDFLKTHILGDYYILIFEDYKPQMARVLRLFLDNTSGITLFHCAVGKDRTGVVAAVLYLLAGASHEDIVNNYKVSFEYGKAVLSVVYDQKTPLLKHTARSDAENMEKLLAHIDSKYHGNIVEYLQSLGLSDSEIISLRNKCIE